MMLLKPHKMRVTALSPLNSSGWLLDGDRRYRVALGRSGWLARKREGDGASPVGTWRAIRVLYRPDRAQRPRTGLPLARIDPSSGWCDAAGDRNYNRPVRLPYRASAERMWRADGLYDLVVVLDHNMRPRVQGAGSAIFMHLARAEYRPTEGCIALSARDLRLVLERLRPGSRLIIGSGARPATHRR